ncbi:tryptophan transporter [Zhaonella formicivorans]|jgi:hypothetical protein|uniref:tryptophan transporter n=1 Tax=Zhaonella formicivorans TaxID=2528593 RepID=UPI0010DC9246|nr:tryptophan transporter [Zhaonella formicivorans]
MSLRDSIQVALLLAIGTILHLVVPGYGSGMKPDLLLGMFFIVLLLKRDFRSTLLASLLAGLLSAFATTFPGGQLPNIIDKLITGLVVFAMVKLLYGRINNYVLTGIIGVLGTLVSGAAFLGSALAIVGLPAPFMALFTTVVLPAAVLNTIAVIILYPVVLFSKNTIERSSNRTV